MTLQGERLFYTSVNFKCIFYISDSQIGVRGPFGVRDAILGVTQRSLWYAAW